MDSFGDSVGLNSRTLLTDFLRENYCRAKVVIKMSLFRILSTITRKFTTVLGQSEW